MIGQTISHYKSQNYLRVPVCGTGGCNFEDPDESAIADEEGTLT